MLRDNRYIPSAVIIVAPTCSPQSLHIASYPVTIPDISENEVYKPKRIILEQNNYFISITKRGENDN